MQIILWKALRCIYLYLVLRGKKKTLFQVIQVAVMLCYDADYSSLSYYVNDVHPQSDQKSP